MALNFPTNPVNGATYTGDNGITYTYNNGKWIGTGAVSVTIPDHLLNGSHRLLLNNDGTVGFPSFTFPATDGTNGQVLKTNGSGVLTWQGDNTGGGGGPSLGDIAFVGNAMYNFGGITVENADLSHGASAALVIPANSDSSPVQLNNLFDNVNVSTGNSGSIAHTWTFGNDGNLTLPNGSVIKNHDGSVYSTGGGGGPVTSLNNGPKSLALGTNGNLTLNSGPTIGSAQENGASIQVKAGAGAWSGILSNNENNMVWVDDGNAYVTTSAHSAQNRWTFRSDGNLQLPVGGSIVDSSGNGILGEVSYLANNGNYANLEADGTLTLPGNVTVGTLNDGDVVFWAPPEAEYAGLWWGGNKLGSNIGGYGPDVSVTAGAQAIDDPGTGDPTPQVHVKVYDKHWSFKQSGDIVRENGDRVAMYRELPKDVSDLSDRTSLLAQNAARAAINIDGGGAYVMYEPVTAADGGFSGSRFGRASTVFDGGAKATTSTFELTLDGGGA